MYVQCYGESFEVHNFVFLISYFVSMHNFTVEKVFFKIKSYTLIKFHTFCPPSVSQILNAVLSGQGIVKGDSVMALRA